MADSPAHIPACVLVTGATRDFGLAIARGFAALGCKIILHGRDIGKVEETAHTFDVPVHPLVFDITDKTATIREIAAIPDAFRDIDVLVNNAGGAIGLDPAHKAVLEDWESMIDTNNTALVRITRLILPGMVDRKRGHIINIGSTAGTYPYPGGNVYCAAKAFTKQFSLSLRADLAGTNVRVTNLEPGMAETGFSLGRFKGDAQKADSVYANTAPLKAEDVAQAVVWAATLPQHVNINRVEMMPTVQSFSSLAVERFGT